MRSCSTKPRAVAILLALAAQANAGLIRFDNANPGQPDYFDWGESTWLDIRSSRHAQAGGDNGTSSFGQFLSFGTGFIQGTPGAAELEVFKEEPGTNFVAPTDVGFIPSGFEFSEMGFSFLGGSLLPEGEITYLGLRFMQSDWHYGWIGVIREGNTVDTFAWAYDTVPNRPIVAGVFPEPSTILMSLFGAALVALRKPRPEGTNHA